MTIDVQSIKDYIAAIRAHFARADAMLDYANTSLDVAIAKLENPPIGPASQFGFVGKTCVVPSAPVADIIKCLDGGGIVNAVVEIRPVKYPATRAILQSSTAMVRITKCSESEMSVICDLPGIDVVKNPKQAILWVAMNPVGG